MSWVKCPNCQKLTPDYKVLCIGCGADYGKLAAESKVLLKSTADDVVASSQASVDRNIIAIGIAVTVAVAVAFLVLRSGSAPESAASSDTGMVGAEFKTLQECLDGIRRNSGAVLTVVSDTPDKVSGKFKDGRFFSCERVNSGTKGSYFEGWYTTR